MGYSFGVRMWTCANLTSYVGMLLSVKTVVLKRENNQQKSLECPKNGKNKGNYILEFPTGDYYFKP